MDWGPIPQLWQRLSLSPLGERNGALRDSASPSLVDAWAEYINARNDFWPDVLSLNPIPTRVWWRRLLSRLPNLPGRGRRRSEDLPDLETLLIRSHAWLTQPMRHHLAKAFDPFPTDIPTTWRTVPPQALSWTLDMYKSVAQALDPSRRQGSPTPPQHDLALPTSFIEVLYRHFLLEDVVKSLATQRLREIPPLSQHQKSGGLRTAYFLQVYSLLVSTGAPAMVRDWEVALRPFFAASPLTQLIYADLFFVTIPGAGKVHEGYKCLTAPLRGASDDSPFWANAFWYSQLARSLLGALLSQAPAYAHWKEADNRRQRLEGQLKAMPVKPARPRRQLEKQLQDAQTQCEALLQQRATQHTARLVAVGDILTSVSAGTLLRIQLLDMLIRHTASCAMPAMLNEWKRRDRSTLPRVDILFEAGGACYQAFEKVLLGDQSLADIQPRLGEQNTESLRQGLRGLLECPDVPPDAVASLASDSAISEPNAKALIDRFTRIGVDLPFADARDEPSPRTILAVWQVKLDEAFPAQVQVTPI